MNLELRGIKHFSSLSEETLCFEATLYVNGKKAASAANRGEGGCNEIHPFNAEGAALVEAAAAFAKTLPPVPSGFKDCGPLPMDLDLWISVEVGRFADRKENERLCKAKTSFYQSPEERERGMLVTYDEAYSVPLREKILAEHPQAIFLNDEIGQKPQAERALGNHILRAMKKHLIFSLDGNIRKNASRYSAPLAAALRARHPQVVILNEQYNIY